MSTIVTPTGRDIVDLIIAFEQGDLEPEGILELFAELIATGTCWSLQGSYGRYAKRLIENGLITPDGEITDEGRLFF
jgi:hypothetical protein